MANRFLNNIRINDEYTLPATDGSADQVITTDGAGNLSFIDVNSVIDAATGEVYYTCKNSTGATLAKGTGVMAVGTDGNSGHILMDEMVADGSVEPKRFLGVLSESTGNGNTGRVIHFGQIDQLNTNGQNGETWNDGDILWCDPDSPGDFTNVEPDGPNVKIAAVIVLFAATNGKIQVRVQANEGIHDLHDTKITTQADGELLVWDNTTGVWMNDGTATVDYTNNRVGVNNTSPSETLHVSGDSLVNNYWSPVTTNAYYMSYDSTRGMYLDSSGFITLNAGGNERIRITSTGNVGIGTTSPSAKLHVSSGTNDIISESTTASQASRLILKTPDREFRLGTNSDRFWIYDANAAAYRMWINSSGNVGIGTTSPSQKLQVNGIGEFAGALRITETGTSQNILIGNQDSGGTNTPAMINGVNGSLRFGKGNSWSGEGGTFTETMRVDSSGNVGIGTTSPDGKLHVATSGESKLDIEDTGGQQYRFFVRNSDKVFGIYDVSNPLTWFRYTGNATVANTKLALLEGGGNVGIGTTSPTQKLHVSGNARVTGALYDSNNSAGTSGQVLSSTGTGTDWVNQNTLEVCNLFVEVKASSIGGVAYPYWNGNGYATAATLSSQKIATYSGSLDVVKIACSGSVTGVSMDLYKASSPTVPIWSSGSFNLTANTVYSISPSSAAVTANDLLYLQFNYPGSGAVSYNLSLGFIYN